jgi:hypothetical protein
MQYEGEVQLAYIGNRTSHYKLMPQPRMMIGPLLETAK